MLDQPLAGEDEMYSSDPTTLRKDSNVLADAAAQNGDLLALDLIHQTAFYMGWGIANLVNIVNPEVVLIGTVAVAAGDLLLDPIRRTVQQMAMTRPAQTVRILPAKLGDRIGDLASISLVI